MNRDDLRTQAEDSVWRDEGPAAEPPAPLSPEDQRRLLHELQVHRVELEMQNEALREANSALAEREVSYRTLFLQDRGAEQELRGSHALMERAEKLAKFGNWELDLARRTIRVSPGAKRIYGLMKTEWSLEEAQKFVLPEYRALADAALRDLVERQKPYSVMFRIKRAADGRLRDIHSIAEYDPAKGLVFGVIYDITHRHRLEAALESRVLALAQPVADQAGTAFEDVFNLNDIQQLQDGFALATGVASIITRPDGTPLTRPSQFTRLCGEIVLKTEAGCRDCHESQLATGRMHLDGPNVGRCLSGGLWDAGAAISAGGRHIASWLIGQVRNAAADPETVAAYAREIGADEPAFMAAYREVPAMPAEQFRHVADVLHTLARHLSISAHQNLQQAALITGLRESEARNRSLAEDLEQKVKERTAQLETANRELEAFSDSVSHDLRAPLRSIHGYCQALREDHLGQLDPAGQHHVERILLGAGRMGQIIDDLLDLSRLGRRELKREAVDLAGICRRILDDLARADPERQVAVLIQPDLRLEADPGLMEVVLENLLRNAWKFTGRTRQPRIAVGEQALAGGERAFFIQDNGAGFDPARAGKLFEAFQRLHSAEEFEGTGIGLAIVRRAIQRHGGRVWAEAEPGKGATFRFTLPG